MSFSSFNMSRILASCHVVVFPWGMSASALCVSREIRPMTFSALRFAVNEQTTFWNR
jgi:hypothetical protein